MYPYITQSPTPTLTLLAVSVGLYAFYSRGIDILVAGVGFRALQGNLVAYRKLEAPAERSSKDEPGKNVGSLSHVNVNR